MPHPVSFVAWDGTDFRIVTIDTSGHLQVDLLSSVLPTGAATAANQLTEITALQLIDDLRAALHSVNTDELQVNVEDSVLPTGAATSANQATEITDLETMMLYDRGLSKIVNSYSASLAAHAITMRYTYTVPANRLALLEVVYFYSDQPDVGKMSRVLVQINGITAIQIYAENGNTLISSRILNWSGAIWLPTGAVVTLLTFSSALVNLTLQGMTTISEFNA
jgi:hypothetical protein